jgi:hypothetical protein
MCWIDFWVKSGNVGHDWRFFEKAIIQFQLLWKNEIEIWGFVEDVRYITSYNDVLGKDK